MMADSFIADSFMPDKGGAATKTAPPPVDPAEQREKGQVLPTGRNWKPPRTALDVMLNPQGVPEHLLSIPASAALFGGGAKLAQMGAQAANLPAWVQRAAPAIGRIATGTGESAAAAAVRGESPGKIAAEAGKGGLATTVTEGLLSGLDPKGTLRAGRRAFEEAKDLPGQALDLLRGRLKTRSLFGGGVTLPSQISVPSIQRAKMTVQEAVDKLATLRGPAYQQALKEIEQGMNALDKTKLTPPAGTAFRELVAQTLKEPQQGIRGAMQSPAGRSIADALATSPIYGMPALGVAGAFANPGSVPDLAMRYVRGLIPH
jgi:hypothetical protein